VIGRHRLPTAREQENKRNNERETHAATLTSYFPRRKVLTPSLDRDFVDVPSATLYIDLTNETAPNHTRPHALRRDSVLRGRYYRPQAD
jgi:hypothetical protein